MAIWKMFFSLFQFHHGLHEISVFNSSHFFLLWDSFSDCFFLPAHLSQGNWDRVYYSIIKNKCVSERHKNLHWRLPGGRSIRSVVATSTPVTPMEKIFALIFFSNLSKMRHLRYYNYSDFGFHQTIHFYITIAEVYLLFK